jgi:phosphoglycolate phosphatase
MEMARAAGIEGIGVSWGYHGRERLLSAGASRVVGDMGELREHVFGCGL